MEFTRRKMPRLIQNYVRVAPYHFLRVVYRPFLILVASVEPATVLQMQTDTTQVSRETEVSLRHMTAKKISNL
jgi:hypothetical protein